MLSTQIIIVANDGLIAKDGSIFFILLKYSRYSLHFENRTETRPVK
jgi:hypothetical protein